MQKYEEQEQHLLDEMNPEEKAVLPRWMPLLLLLHLTWFLVILYYFIVWAINLQHCIYCDRNPASELIRLINLLIIPVAVYFAWRKRKTGWILLYGFCCYNMLFHFVALLMVFISGAGFTEFPFELSCVFTLMILSIVALSRKSMMAIYGISRKSRRLTLWGALGCVLILSALVALLIALRH